DTVELSDLPASRGTFQINAAMMFSIETLHLTSGGNNFNFQSADDLIAAGATLTIDARDLTTESLTFSGALETNGKFDFFGSDQGDTLTGGAGADHFTLGKGSNTANGGGGNDVFDADFIEGFDHYTGGAGNDVFNLSGYSDYVIDGGDGNDTFVERNIFASLQ